MPDKQLAASGTTILACGSAIFRLLESQRHQTPPLRERVCDICQTSNPIKPSIAQLEERGTVICNLSSVLSQGRWFDPGSKDVLFLSISSYFPTNDSMILVATIKISSNTCHAKLQLV